MPDDPNPDAPTDDVDPTPDPEPEPKDDLGDAGKKALESERRARRKAEQELKKLQAEAEELRNAQLTDQEKAIADARREARNEATSEANKRIVAAEVKAAAAKKLNDPADALALIDLGSISIDDDGNVDTEAISTAIDELVAAKPYLAAGATPASPGNGDGGARHKQPPSTLAQQIAEAEAKGDVATALSLKAQQLIAAS